MINKVFNSIVRYSWNIGDKFVYLGHECHLSKIPINVYAN